MSEVQELKRRRVADCWFVNASQLQRSGRFGAADCEFGWWWGSIKAENFVRVRWDATHRVLALDLSGSHVDPFAVSPLKVNVTTKRCGRATKTYFQMNGACEIFEDLCFIDGEIGSRSSLNLRYERNRVSDAPSASIWINPNLAYKIGTPALLTAKAVGAEEPIAQPYSTRAAIRNGAQVSETDPKTMSEFARAARPHRGGASRCEIGQSRGKLPVQLDTEFPQLDVLELQRSGRLKVGRQEDTVMRWTDTAKPTVSGFVTADLRELATPCLRLAMNGPATNDGETSSHQRVELSPPAVGAPNQWAAICPVSGRRTRSLWLRNGVWASAKAHNLVKPSQRTAGFARRRRAALTRSSARPPAG